MKKIFFLIVITFFTISTYSQVRVSGYFRKNGTYVQPHMRSSPNSSPYDNYSFPGNTNPYTGKTATGSEEAYLNRYDNKTLNSSPEINSMNTYKNTYPVNNTINSNYPATYSQANSSINRNGNVIKNKDLNPEEIKKKKAEDELNSIIYQFEILSKKRKLNEKN